MKNNDADARPIDSSSSLPSDLDVAGTDVETSIGQKVFQELLVSQCIGFQKRRVYFIGPAMFAITLFAHIYARVWQTAIVLGVLVATNFFFNVALRVSQKQQIEKSLWYAVIPTLVTCMAVIILIDGFGAAMILTAIAIVVQSSVFSKRISVVGAVSVFLLLVMDLIMNIYVQHVRYVVSPGVTFWAAVMVGGLMSFQFWVHLRKHHDNNQEFQRKQVQMGARQRRIAQSVSDTMPPLEGAVEKLSGFSEEVVEKSQFQAEAMDRMASEVKTMITTAEQTKGHAHKSNQLAAQMQSEMQSNVHRLNAVGDTFATVLKNMREAREIMGGLAANTENIESILTYNRDIGEHIKVLSVNASIEAAAAGEYGAGFAVVARELREMIDSTETNLFRSHAILHEIRRQSAMGTEAMDSINVMLDAFSHELKNTRETLIRTSDNAATASRELSEIASSATDQHRDLSGMSSKVDMLLDSSFELAISSSNLSDIVSHLNTLKQTLAQSVR